MHRIDFHCHSLVSADGSLHETDIKRMLDDGLDSIAITDHDRIDEAVRLQEILGDSIIIGEEISTTDGEIIALYIQEVIKPNMSAIETVDAIKQQNGIVYIPHPFEKVRRGLNLEVLNSIASRVDIIETINGRSFSSKAREQAVIWARKHDVAMAAASDAHGRYGWGRVYSVLSEKPNKNTLTDLMIDAKLHGKSNGYVSYLYPKLNRLRKAVQN